MSSSWSEQEGSWSEQDGSWSEQEEDDADDEDDPYAYLSRRDNADDTTMVSNTSQVPTPQGLSQSPTPQQQQQQQQQQQHPQETTTVCCGCRPKATSTKWKRYKKKSRFNIFQSSTKYYDAPESHLPKTGKTRIQQEEVSESSMFYFDAVETPLGEDEYPPFFTTSILHPKPNVTLEDPITLLKHDPTSPLKGRISEDDEEEEEEEEQVDLRPHKPISSHKRRSVRWDEITRRPTMEHTHALSEPRVPQAEQGYPGELTVHELEECVSTIIHVHIHTYTHIHIHILLYVTWTHSVSFHPSSHAHHVLSKHSCAA
jgi:hypothetical protein